MKVNARKATFEFLSIVVAVVLAMALTEWRQEYLNRKLAEQSFRNIVEEIKENYEELKLDSARLARDGISMQEWVRKKHNGEDPELFVVEFSFSILSSAARDVAQINQSLTHLSNEKNMDLAELYALQDFYSNAGREVFDLMGDFQAYLTKTESPEFFETVQKLRFRMSLVLNTVRAYISQCEQFLEKHAERIPE